MVVGTRGDDDDDEGGDGDRKLDGSNGSSSVCVGGTGCTLYNRLTHLDCWTIIMTVINPFSIAVNKVLKISIRSLHSSTSCHLLDLPLSFVVQSLVENYSRWLRTSSPTTTRDFPVNQMTFAKKPWEGTGLFVTIHLNALSGSISIIFYHNSRRLIIHLRTELLTLEKC